MKNREKTKAKENKHIWSINSVSVIVSTFILAKADFAPFIKDKKHG